MAMAPNWVRIASFSSSEDAYIVKGMLESNDIPVEISNATISSVYPMTDTWAPIELFVPRELETEAQRLLKINGDK